MTEPRTPAGPRPPPAPAPRSLPPSVHEIAAPAAKVHPPRPGAAGARPQIVALVWPPSSTQFCPTTKPAWTEARKAQALPNSSAVP